MAGRGRDRPLSIRKNGYIRRKTQAGIDDDPEGIPAPDKAAGELRVVRKDGARADEDRVVDRPQPVGETEGRGRADPARVARGGGNPAVEGLGELQGDIGKAGPDVFEEDPVALPAGLLEDADLRFDAALSEDLDAPPGDEGVGIDGADDHAARAVRDQGFDAGGGPAVMAARLQGDVEGRPRDRFRCIPDGVDLRVVLAAAVVEAFGDDPAAPDDNGADQGIRADASFPLPGQREGPAHEPLIERTSFFIFHDLLPQ